MDSLLYSKCLGPSGSNSSSNCEDTAFFRESFGQALESGSDSSHYRDVISEKDSDAEGSTAGMDEKLVGRAWKRSRNAWY